MIPLRSQLALMVSDWFSAFLLPPTPPRKRSLKTSVATLFKSPLKLPLKPPLKQHLESHLKLA